MTEKTHPFQQRGLGFAPFRLVKVVHDGAGCAYCGSAIGTQYVCADVDGKEFSVGSDCIMKVTSQGREDPKFVREFKRLKRETEKKATYERFRAAYDRLHAEPTLFSDQPHPEGHQDKTRNMLGVCIYDDAEDPEHDSCVFCHEPLERK